MEPQNIVAKKKYPKEKPVGQWRMKTQELQSLLGFSTSQQVKALCISASLYILISSAQLYAAHVAHSQAGPVPLKIAASLRQTCQPNIPNTLLIDRYIYVVMADTRGSCHSQSSDEPNVRLYNPKSAI